MKDYSFDDLKTDMETTLSILSAKHYGMTNSRDIDNHLVSTIQKVMEGRASVENLLVASALASEALRAEFTLSEDVSSKVKAVLNENRDRAEVKL